MPILQPILQIVATALLVAVISLQIINANSKHSRNELVILLLTIYIVLDIVYDVYFH